MCWMVKDDTEIAELLGLAENDVPGFSLEAISFSLCCTVQYLPIDLVLHLCLWCL